MTLNRARRTQTSSCLLLLLLLLLLAGRWQVRCPVKNGWCIFQHVSICLFLPKYVNYLMDWRYLEMNCLKHTVNIYRYKAIGANATSSVITAYYNVIEMHIYLYIVVFLTFHLTLMPGPAPSTTLALLFVNAPRYRYLIQPRVSTSHKRSLMTEK